MEILEKKMKKTLPIDPGLSYWLNFYQKRHILKKILNIKQLSGHIDRIASTFCFWYLDVIDTLQTVFFTVFNLNSN